MADKPKNEPGKFTTEFFLVIISNITAVVGAIKGFIGPELAASIVITLNGIYAIIRTWRKNSADKKEIELKKMESSNGQ